MKIKKINGLIYLIEINRGDIMNNKLNNFNERNFITALKSFAIFSVVSAHVGGVDKNTNELNLFFSRILGQIGSIGVGIFFLISGYLFYKNKDSLVNFFRKRSVSIFVPWILTGTAVYLVGVFGGKKFEIISWFNWLIGNGTYLYYLTILIVFYLVFFYLSKNNFFIISTILLSFISIALTSTGTLDGINPYLNPFNFVCYFSIGMIISRKDNLINLAKRCMKHRYSLLLLYIFLVLIVWYFDISSGYWGSASLILQPVSIATVFGFAANDSVYKEKFLLIGKESFSIYLLHMPVAGKIASIFNSYNLWLFTLARPFIVIGITLGFILIYKKIGEVLRIDNFTNRLIGLR